MLDRYLIGRLGKDGWEDRNIKGERDTCTEGAKG